MDSGYLFIYLFIAYGPSAGFNLLPIFLNKVSLVYTHIYMGYKTKMFTTWFSVALLHSTKDLKHLSFIYNTKDV